MVDIRTIGAGGGSIAWIDAGGLLRVGPKSAGSDRRARPATGRAARDATLTDANLMLGRLNPDNFCGGEIPLDARARARRRWADSPSTLGGRARQRLRTIIELANHNMVDALSVISVEQGIDPREFTLVAFGGAGPLHAADIARILGSAGCSFRRIPGNTRPSDC